MKGLDLLGPEEGKKKRFRRSEKRWVEYTMIGWNRVILRATWGVLLMPGLSNMAAVHKRWGSSCLDEKSMA